MSILLRLASFLALTAVYLALAAKPFFAWWATNADFHSWAAALQALSNVSDTMALNAVPLLVLLFLSMSLAVITIAAAQLLIDTLQLMVHDLFRAGDRLRTLLRARHADRR